MKIIILLLTAIILHGTGYIMSQDKEPEFKMKTYFFVLLKTGPNTSQDTAAINKAFTGHMANINAMADLGKLKLAGPLSGNPELRGFFVIDAATEEEIKELLSKDTAITEGFLVPEILKWWGPNEIKTEY